MDLWVALYQDFRKIEKKSKASAIQEKNSKMAGAPKRKSGIPKKIWESNPGIELWQLTRLTGQPLGAGKHRVSPLALRARWSCPRGERRARKTMSTFF